MNEYKNKIKQLVEEFDETLDPDETYACRMEYLLNLYRSMLQASKTYSITDIKLLNETFVLFQQRTNDFVMYFNNKK